MKIKPFIVTSCLLTITIACGKKMTEPEPTKIQEEEMNPDPQGDYLARLFPLNETISGNTVGEFRVSITGDSVSIRGAVENSPPVAHRQQIHNSPNCPGPEADVDRDGAINDRESRAITGREILILDPFPMPGAYGNYSYAEASSLTKVLSDMQMNGEELNLSRRTIVIYGARGDRFLPIACGTFFREN